MFQILHTTFIEYINFVLKGLRLLGYNDDLSFILNDAQV